MLTINNQSDGTCPGRCRSPLSCGDAAGKAERERGPPDTGHTIVDRGTPPILLIHRPTRTWEVWGEHAHTEEKKMKTKAEKFYVTRFTVVGRTAFPIDMLRYDQCFPASEADSSRITNTINRDRTMNPGLTSKEIGMYKIDLVMISRNNSGPTVGRWNSFCWGIVSIDETRTARR